MSNPTLLLIDDSCAIRSSMTRLLGRSFQVLSAASAEDGLSLIHTRPDIELILCDVMMPGIGAQGLLPLLPDHLRQRIVIMTAGVPARALLSDLRSEGIPLVRKPFTLQALLATLNERLNATAEPAYRTSPMLRDDSAAMSNSHPA